MKNIKALNLKLSKRILKNVDLAPYTTFRIGGKAKYFFEAKSNNDIISLVNFCRKKKLPFFILGGGSNLLISDKGFNGLVIRNKSSKVEIRENYIIADGGVILARLIQEAVSRSLSGLEYFVGIPGTLGGAIFGNAGWPKGKKSIGDLVEEIEILLPNNKIKKVKKDWSRFAYRSSRFKEYKNPPIILSAKLKLKKEKRNKIEKRIKEIIKERRKNAPSGFSAGCVFKNVQIEEIKNKKEIPKEFKKNQLISAGWLIDQCGLKGKGIGGAEISKEHANFIINRGKSKAIDVLKLIELIKRNVKKRFGVDLKEEIQLIGF